jgi:protein TonB
MSLTPSEQLSKDRPSRPLLVLALGLSLLGHAALIFWLPSQAQRSAVASNRVELEIIDLPPPPPPPPPPPEPKPPDLEPPKPKLVVKVDTPKLAPEQPPPPNEPAKEVPDKPVPIVVGVSLSNTAEGGSFAAPVGNTVYGKTDTKAVDPSSVKAYSAPKYAPPGGADSEPSLLGEVRVDYPEEARKAGIEGSVRLKVTIDAGGQVTEVVVINGPGYGLNEAAREALRRFRFSPATQKGEPVRYAFFYTYTFLLD